MKREEAGGETAAIGSVPAPHLPATPLPAPQTRLNSNFLLFPGGVRNPLFPRERGCSAVAGRGRQRAGGGGFAGRALRGGRRESCRGDNAACLFATAKMAVLKGKGKEGKKKKEREVLLHIQSPHLLIE